MDTGINRNPEAIGRMVVQLLVSQINLNERGVPTIASRILVESSG